MIHPIKPSIPEQYANLTQHQIINKIKKADNIHSLICKKLHSGMIDQKQTNHLVHKLNQLDSILQDLHNARRLLTK